MEIGFLESDVAPLHWRPTTLGLIVQNLRLTMVSMGMEPVRSKGGIAINQSTRIPLLSECIFPDWLIVTTVVPFY